MVVNYYANLKISTINKPVIKYSLLIIVSLLFSNSLCGKICYESQLIKPQPFMGNDGEIFKLSNGILGEIKSEYEYMYEYYPQVIICPDQNQLIVSGKTLNIQLLSKNNHIGNKITVTESNIDGNFDGFKGDTIMKLTNGQIWQQSEYYYWYHYAYSPKVVIFETRYGYKMQVNGIKKQIGVIRLK